MAQAPIHQADIVRKVGSLALSDAVEITILIDLIKKQNADGINAALNKAGAGRAGAVLHNSMIARLVTIVARAYAPRKEGDSHVRVAKDLLKHNVTRQIFTTAAGGKGRIDDFEARWSKCCGDHRREKVKVFRDKYTAHLGEPTEIDEPTYKELFGFAAATAELMESLAFATRAAVQPIASDPDVAASPGNFWKAWKTGDGA